MIIPKKMNSQSTPTINPDLFREIMDKLDTLPDTEFVKGKIDFTLYCEIGRILGRHNLMATDTGNPDMNFNEVRFYNYRLISRYRSIIKQLI
jgi:hypothetical protein